MQANKPVVLEEYGCPNGSLGYNHSVAAPWQDTVLKAHVAADQIWQFGPANLSDSVDRDALDSGEHFIIYYDKPEYQKLAEKHARAMLDKKVESGVV